MIDKLIHFSIKNKLVIGLFTAVLIILGSYSVTQLPIDVVPDITNNQVLVLTQCPTLSAQEVEQYVTSPVEMSLSTLPELQELRSISRFGLSNITVVFKDNTDIWQARQWIAEKLKEADGNIPKGISRPEIAPPVSGLSEISQYVVRAKVGYEKKYSAMDLRTVHDWIIRRQLLGVPGVAEITAWGGELKQYEISLNPTQIIAMNISITDVFNALQKNNQNTGAAFIEKNENAYFIRGIGQTQTFADIEKIVIKNNKGIPVYLKDVAKVQFGAAIRNGAISRNGNGEVVGGMVLMRKGESSSKVIADVKRRMVEIEKSLPEGVVLEQYLDRQNLVSRTISTVSKNLIEGALIVIFILVLFLGNWRAGLIVASVIPLAMLFAISMMNLFGISGNLMSLGAIDFGLIVDGAVIIVEATLHHLMKNKGRLFTQTEMDTEVYDSARKIRSSAAFGEIIILIVYIPILTMSGIEGKMFIPMAQTVGFSIAGAFILSLTYVPMASAMFLNKHITNKRNISDKLMDFFQRIYAPIINGALKRKAIVIVASFALFIIAFFAFSNMGGEFMPTLEEGDFAVNCSLLPGSSLSNTIDKQTKCEKILLQKFPEVKEVISRAGAPEIPTDPMPFEITDLMIMLKPKEEWKSATSREELVEKMKAELSIIPGMTFEFTQPIQMRFNELMTGARQDVVIKVFGEDLKVLKDIGDNIASQIKTIDGVKDIKVEQLTGLPQIQVYYDRDKLAQFDVNVEDVNTILRTAFAGEKAGVVYEGERRFDVVVRLDKAHRTEIEDVKKLPIPLKNNMQVPLEQLANIVFEEGPSQISRDDAKRRINIGFNVRGSDVQTVVDKVNFILNQKKAQLPSGYHYTIGGQFENLIEAKKRLSVAVPIALGLILMLLYFTFGSFKQSILIFTAIPLSAIGGVFALMLRGMPFSVSAGVGFIALFGVAVLNGIVLIAEFNRLKKEGLTDLKEIVLRGTHTRLRPVLMTATVASLGFLPMALSTGAGGEVQKPLATVVIGGLITATFLTLVVLPILYIYFEKAMKTKIEKPIAGTIIFFLISVGSIKAQNNSPYTLEQCVQEAIKNNATVKAGTYEINLQSKLKQTSTDIGKTDVSLLYGQYNSLNIDNSFTVSQKLPFPTVFMSNAAYYNAQIKSSEFKLSVTKNELMYKVKSAFQQLQFLYAYDKLLQQQDSIFNEFVRAATLRFKGGDGTLLEKATAESRLQELRNLSLQNKSNIEIYLAQLQTLMNSNADINIANVDFIKLDLALNISDSSGYISNPLVNYFKQQIEIAEKLTQLDRNKLLPDITLGYFNQSLIGYYTVNGQDQYFGAGNRFQGIQIGLSIPLWFAPQTARISANKINQQIAQSNYEAEQKNLEGQYKQIIQEYLKLKSTLDYFVSIQLPQSKLISEQSQKAFKSGEIGYYEHSQNLVQSLQIQSNYLTTLNQYNQVVYQVQFITGKN